MKMVYGEIVVAGRLAYVPQQPWIINASLRDNVLLGSDFDQDRSDFESILAEVGNDGGVVPMTAKNYANLKQDAVGRRQTSPPVLPPRVSTKQRCLSSDWFCHLANWTKDTRRL